MLDYWLGGGLESRKNAFGEDAPPTVPLTVGRQPLGIQVHFRALPIKVGVEFVLPVPLP